MVKIQENILISIASVLNENLKHAGIDISQSEVDGKFTLSIASSSFKDIPIREREVLVQNILLKDKKIKKYLLNNDNFTPHKKEIQPSDAGSEKSPPIWLEGFRASRKPSAKTNPESNIIVKFANEKTLVPLWMVDVEKPSKQTIGEPRFIANSDGSHEIIDRKAYEAVKTLILANGGTEKDLENLVNRGVFSRMRFGIHPYYEALALGNEYIDPQGNKLLDKSAPSRSVLNLILPRPDEVVDLTGDKDPSNQMKYSMLDGTALNKYQEIVLAYVSVACSAHCRYCYRVDLFSKETRKETGKSILKDPENLTRYIAEHNAKLGGSEIRTIDGKKNYRIKEVLLSGGDAMNLTDHKLYEYLAASAQSGVDLVRIGTKELAFRPERVNDDFIKMLKHFNKQYPETRIYFATHFSHPDEFLKRDENGNYIKTGVENNQYKWLDGVKKSVSKLKDLPFVTLENQTPMIKNVNDNADDLRILHQELVRGGIKNKYIFGCRHIKGYASFAVPLEDAFKIYTESQKGLSDAARSRFAISTEQGKMEVVSVIDKIPEEVLNRIPEIGDRRNVVRKTFGDGFIVFKIHRAPGDADTLSDLVIAKRNPQATWISDYEDRIIYDGRKNDKTNKFEGLETILNTVTNSNDLSKFISTKIEQNMPLEQMVTVFPEQFLNPESLGKILNNDPTSINNLLKLASKSKAINVFTLGAYDGNFGAESAKVELVIHHSEVSKFKSFISENAKKYGQQTSLFGADDNSKTAVNFSR